MIVCPRCSRHNKDHYKFCLGCGADLSKVMPVGEMPEAADSPAKSTGRHSQVKQPGAVATSAAKPEPPAAQAAPAAQAPTAAARPSPAPAAALKYKSEPPKPLVKSAPLSAKAEGGENAATITCPKCGTVSPENFKFCPDCGFSFVGAAAPGVRLAQAQLVLIENNGAEGGSWPLSSAGTVLGRELGGALADDSYLSPRHCLITPGKGRFLVKDLGSLNGTFFRIDAGRDFPLKSGLRFRIGQEVIRYESLRVMTPPGDVAFLGSPSAGLVGRVQLVLGPNTTGNAFCVGENGISLGREMGDVLFPEDGYVSGLHCRIQMAKERAVITDLNSSNGTFVEISGEVELPTGVILLVGQHLCRIDCP